ncbi:MAG TPA: patatin-like phospholipase family protein [Patescibacteria group bacterium]|nr:patatin-like phospholipase family protein [Patescibacteria group bacterium]
MENKARPKIGIALSGASGRTIAHVGVLEVLSENNIPLDFMVGCSSGALVAASFASQTLSMLKDELFDMTKLKLFGLMNPRDAKGAIFKLDKATAWFEKHIKGLTFENANPRLGFVAADINTGELINITSGDLTRAINATVAVPGLFEPAVIDNRILVDGGLVNIVPTRAVKDMGADIIIGVNIAATKFIYEKRLPIWRGYKFITRLLGLQFVREKILPFLSSRVLFQFDSQSDILEQGDIEIPGVLTMLTKALDWSMKVSEEWTDSEMACDLMIEPRVKHYGKTEFASLEKIYIEGRKAAKDALPQIKKMIEEFEKKHEYQRIK